MRRTRHGLRRASIIAAAVLLLWTPRIDALPQSPSATLPGVDGVDYLIQIGDQLDIKFFYNPTLNEQITVRPDGRISLQLNLKKARDGSDAGQDISLAPFDIVFVPRSRMSNVNVWMDQYIRQNIPIPFGLQYGLVK
jgi:hypothetical protein